MQSAQKHYQNHFNAHQREEMFLRHLEIVREQVESAMIEVPFDFNRDEANEAGIRGLLSAHSTRKDEIFSDKHPILMSRIRESIVGYVRVHSRAQSMLDDLGQIQERIFGNSTPFSEEELAMFVDVPSSYVCDCLALGRLLDGEQNLAIQQEGAEKNGTFLTYRIARLIEALPGHQRLLLSLYYLDGMSAAKIVGMTGEEPVKFRRTLGIAYYRVKHHIANHKNVEANR